MGNIMKKKMKKLTALFMTVSLAAAMLTGCGSKKSDTIKVGVIQMIDNGAFTDMREGFIQELRDKGYSEDKLTIKYKNAQGDATNLNTICQEMVDDGVDLVCTIATPATQAMVNMETDIPVVFVSVSDPVGAGVLSDFNAPDKNATGTSNAIPVDDIFALANQLTPGCTTYGIMYNTSEVNSVNTAASAKAYLDANNCNYVEAVVTNSSEIQQAAESLVGQVDAIFIPNDAMIQSGMPIVSEVAQEAGIPVYGSSAVMVTSGAFATIAISDTQIGAISADKAIAILEGKSVSEVPAEVVPASATVVNKNVSDALGITFPAEVESEITFVETAE